MISCMLFVHVPTLNEFLAPRRKQGVKKRWGCFFFIFYNDVLYSVRYKGEHLAMECSNFLLGTREITSVTYRITSTSPCQCFLLLPCSTGSFVHHHCTAVCILLPTGSDQPSLELRHVLLGRCSSEMQSGAIDSHPLCLLTSHPI